MINLDTRLLGKCNEAEMWLLLHVAKRLGKKMFCFPSNATLMSDTGWSIDKLREVKRSLVEKGLLVISSGGHGKSNTYHVTTDLIGVFIPADKLSETPSEKPTPLEKPTPSEKETHPPRKNQQDTPSEKPTPKYYPSEVLTSKEGEPPTILERKEKFRQSLAPFLATYGKDLLSDFFNYWTEMNESETKLRVEIEKERTKGVFEIRARLRSWKKNEALYGKKGAPPDTPLKASMPESYHR